MTTFHFPPKEFGDRSDVGLGKLRGLENVDVPFMKSNPDGDTVVVKGNGFNTVTKRPPPSSRLGRYVTEGQLNGSSLSTVFMAYGLRTAFYAKPLSVVGGKQGFLAIGVGRTVFNGSINYSTGIISLERSRNFSSKTTETTVAMQLAKSGIVTYVLFNHARYYRDGGTVVRYETAVFARMFGANVFPITAYSEGGAWFYGAVQGYDLHDHVTFGDFQLRPNIHMICHAVVPRDSIYALGARTVTPDGIVPYPLFQISTDCGRTYNPLFLDFLFVGSTFEYARPRTSGSGLAGLGGYFALFSIEVQSLSETVFFSLEVIVDAVSPVSIVSGGKNYEVRIFRSIGLNLTTMTQVASPPGYGTSWAGPLRATFTETHPSAPPKVFGSPGSGFGAIGYQASPVVATDPNVLFVSFDAGTTWQAPRPLPASSYWCRIVDQISTRELSCSVYEPTLPPQVVRYASTDYGLTWQRRQVIATDVVPLTPTTYLADFLHVLPFDPEDGSPPVPTPMSGWRYDSRIPRYAVRAPA